MEFDFDFDPGTTEDLQREIDGITTRYREQERQINRTNDAARKLENQVSRLGTTARRSFAGGGMGARQTVGNVRDVSELFGGGFSFRNLKGAFELGEGILGDGLIGGFMADAARLAGGAGIAAIAARIAYEPVVSAFENAGQAGRESASLRKTLRRLLGDSEKDSSERIQELAKSIDPQVMERMFEDNGIWRAGGDTSEREAMRREIIERLAAHAAKISEDPDLGSAAIMKYRLRNTSNWSVKAHPELRGKEVAHNREAVARAVFEQAQEDGFNSEFMSEYLEKEIEGFQERSKPLKGWNLVRFQKRERQFNAVAEREKLEQMDWASN